VTDETPTAKRAPRSDGRRNRELLLEAAARAFATEGAEATLNGIARDAGVGIATLFRHFPTREALVEAAYSNSLEHVCSAADALVASTDSHTAARAWFGKLLDYLSQKQGMADTLRALVADDLDSRVNSLDRVVAAVQVLLDAGKADGLLRDDVAAVDVVASISGIALIAGRPQQRAQADRLVDLLLDGLRPVQA
jgi:AcrR family transcriptional regulator